MIRKTGEKGWHPFSESPRKPTWREAWTKYSKELISRLSNGTESTTDVKRWVYSMDVFVSNPATYPVILRILGFFSRKIHISLATIIVYHRAARIFGCSFQAIQYRITLRNFCWSTLVQVLPLRKAFLHCWQQKGALRFNFKSFSEIVRYDVSLWGTFTERRWLALSLSDAKWDVDLPISGSHPNPKKRTSGKKLTGF